MNTIAATSYTPLECLLLFQSLVAYGTRDEDFLRISGLLTNNPLVRDGPTYDARRLGVDALRELYLQLLRDELRAEEQDAQEDGAPTASKKRKLQSPPLPSLKDAQQYKDRLPLLVDRLYAQYRDYMVQAIREDERRYSALQQEIGEIERGEWDERILKEDQALANKNGQAIGEALQSKPNGQIVVESQRPESRPADTKKPESKDTPVPAKISPPAAIPSPQPESRSDGLAINDVLNSQQAPPPVSPRVATQRPQNGVQNTRSPLNQQRPGSTGPPGPPPLQLGQQQPGTVYKWEQYGPPHPQQQQPPLHQPPQHHPPYPPNSPFHPPFSSSQSPYQPPPRGTFSTSHGLPPPHPHLPSSPSPLNTQHPHPVLLPPPSGIHRSPNSPGMPLDALADMAGQQYRAKSGSPLVQQQMSIPPQGYSQPYQPQQRPQPDYSAGQWQQPHPYQPPQPPYQPFAPPNQRTPFSPRPDAIVPEKRTYNSPYNMNQNSNPPLTLASQGPNTKPWPSLPNTPISQGPPRFKTGSGTRWTPIPSGSTPRFERAITPPAVEPLSPILRPLKPGQTTKRIPKKKGPEKTPRAEPAKSSKPPRRGPQRTRAGSTASSVIAGSYRSQSVTSHADELSMDNDTASRHVKQEVSTPVGVEDTGDTTADESSSLPQLHSRPGTFRRAPKRKRDTSPNTEARSPSAPPTHVLWTRNFAKISASALESVSGHRYASTFGHPVKERDAPGYKDLILRPQDLKSIKSAILAGQKAATAAAPADLTASQASVMLPISEDLIPPKGIINNAQLEKELMRMFANAIMFNADPDRGFGRRWQGVGKGKDGDVIGYEIDEDGVVKDTRAMFADVEKIVSNLRSAERRSEELREASLAAGNTGGEDDEDELAGDGEAAGNTGSVTKRRRKA